MRIAYVMQLIAISRSESRRAMTMHPGKLQPWFKSFKELGPRNFEFDSEDSNTNILIYEYVDIHIAYIQY